MSISGIRETIRGVETPFIAVTTLVACAFRGRLTGSPHIGCVPQMTHDVASVVRQVGAIKALTAGMITVSRFGMLCIGTLAGGAAAGAGAVGVRRGGAGRRRRVGGGVDVGGGG